MVIDGYYIVPINDYFSMVIGEYSIVPINYYLVWLLVVISLCLLMII
jgi:hypothetical protein